jgi:hypothetical protein
MNATEILQEQITVLQEYDHHLNNWQFIILDLILFVIIMFSIIRRNNRDNAIKESKEYTDTQIKKLSSINIEMSRNIESLIDMEMTSRV